MEEVKRDRARRKLLRVTFPQKKSSFFSFFVIPLGLRPNFAVHYVSAAYDSYYFLGIINNHCFSII